MLFNSIEFLIFLPIVFLLYWFVFNRSLRWQNALILVASYFFYGWWSWKFMGLLALSTMLDFIYGFWVASPNRHKAKLFLWLSVINNLGILAIFKYYNFFALEFQKFFELFGLNISPYLLNVVLPVGISFYTFHGMSYVFDIYRGKQQPVKNFIDYAVFVSFFPLLVAGPIERAHHLLPQVMNRRVFNYSQAKDGCRLIIMGLFKKIVIADSIAPIVDLAFSSPTSYSSISLIIAAIGFSFQIYADFSGYSDIASGVAKLFGFELLKNFNLPYFSRNIPEFWKRWHISLSSWFRDYVYIPLGGSRVSKIKSIRNVFVVFLLSAFWHGANWTFIIWGMIHAIFFLPGYIKSKFELSTNRSLLNINRKISVIFTFIIVTFAWIFFRAENVNLAFEFLERITNFSLKPDIFKTGTHIILFVKFIVGVLILVLTEYFYVRKELPIPRFLIYLIVLVILFLGSYRNAVSFIYFQF